MKSINVPLELIIPKKNVKSKIENGVLYVPAEQSQMHKNWQYITIPGKFTLPFRIDMTVDLQFIRHHQVTSQLEVYIGKGRIYFNGGHTSCDDVFTSVNKSSTGDNKIANYVFYNGIPTKKYVDISINIGSNMMWVSVDGEYCYASDKLPYIKLLRENAVPNEYENGVGIALCVGTDTKMRMKSFSVIEYENDQSPIPEKLLNLPELSEFELFANGLPPIVHEHICKLDGFLLDDMKKNLKLRRTIDKTNHLFYAAPCGFQYTISELGVGEKHETRWVQTSKKPDLTNQVIQLLNETSPEFAEKMFNKLQVCNPTHKLVCPRRTAVMLNGQSKNVCMSKMRFKMTPEDFDDVKKYITAVSEVVTKK